MQVTQNCQVKCLNNCKSLLDLGAGMYLMQRTGNVRGPMNLKPKYIPIFVRCRVTTPSRNMTSTREPNPVKVQDETGSAGRRPGQGRRWATTPNEDRYLVLTARRHQNINATLLQQHLRSATGTTVSTQTVRNQLHGVGLYARRPMCQIWRGEVLVYGGIPIDGRTDLYIIRDGPLTARRYRDEILRPIVVPYAAAIGDDFILMHDNCRPPRANMVEDFLFEERIVRMEWPAYFPDMDPIEHV
ncbi:transposable element Tcb2 transposase [Trichonephila clavipes]|nr:transposable element Tcb2 transposase [Trichonephila clavipes]